MAEIRENPCVSVNKLGQYLTATPALRKRIIHAQKNPVDPQYLRYPEAAQAIVEFLCGGRDEVILRYHQRRMLNATPETTSMPTGWRCAPRRSSASWCPPTSWR